MITTEIIIDMKAPDKIYVCIPQRSNASAFIQESNYVGMAYKNRGNLTTLQIEEYIRKDALLEWASGELMPGNSAEGKGWNLALQTLIDKLNSM